MTAARTPSEQTSLVSPVIDYEPAPVGPAPCPTPRSLRRHVPRPLPHTSGERRPSLAPAVDPDADPPRAAFLFADAALRRVLEVIDRRRPVAQLRPLLSPPLIDTVVAMTRSTHIGRSEGTAARLRRLRVRMIEDAALGWPRFRGEKVSAAEVFGSYTRGSRVRAIAARIESVGDRWRVVALQVG